MTMRTCVPMHPIEIHLEIKALIAAGVNDCEISRRMGVPRTTVREIRKPRYIRKTRSVVCPRCYRPAREMQFSAVAYCELLGLYLGDGHIVQAGRSQRLRISLDTKYPGIIERSTSLMRCAFTNNRVGSHQQDGGSCTVVWVYSSHLACLFPQHGPGAKHLRPIELEDWQTQLVAQAPWSLLRGLIWSDGCSFVNRTGPYEYPSYAFSNCSEGISRLFVDTCRSVGLKPRDNYSPGRRQWHVRINRRECVALLDEKVGRKN